MYLQSKHEIEKAELQSDQIRARTLSAIVEQDFTSSENLLTSFANGPLLRVAWEHRDLLALKAHLEEMRRLEPAFLFVSMYETTGTMRAIVPSDKIVGQNFAYRDWYQGVTANWRPYVSEVYRTAASPNPLVVAIAVPIRNQQGDPAGILMASYSLSQLASAFSVLEKGATADFYVVDQRGAIAAARGLSAESEPMHLSASAVVTRALAGEEGSGQFPIENRNMFVGYAPVPQLGWAVLYARPESDALAPAKRLWIQNRSVGFYLLLVYLATAALAALLMRRQAQLLAANQTLNLELEKYITESKRAREELDRYFTLSIDMLCIAGSDGYFKRLNPAWQNTLGHTTEELTSKPYVDFVHPEDRQRTIHEAEKLGRGSSTISFENRYLCSDGSYKWLSWTAALFAEGQLIYAVAREITELKQTQDALVRAKEEAERASKFKDQFLSTMSHELRTPLNAVLGFSDLLADERYGTLNDRQKRYVSHIHSGGRHLLNLITDILDLSKIEAGRMEIVHEDVSIASAFGEVLSALQPLADKRSQALTHDVERRLYVRADATRFRQILMNLVGNAIKFTPEAGRIELLARQVGTQVRLEVRDNGPGIAPEEQQRIFEAFFRLAQTGNAEGTGLGLAITARLVELHGSKLEIESKPGEGTCFHFSLPLLSMTPEEPTQNSTVAHQASKSPKILVIEDNAVTGQLIESQLTSSGYEILRCDQPERAAEMAAEHQPQAITLDLLMEPVHGLEVLLQLKNDPRTSQIPVIVVTIVDQPTVGAALGADEYLVKPVDKATLLAAVERCLRSRGGAASARAILVVEDDVSTREMIVALLTSHGYAVSTAADGAQARARVADAMPELVILDLVLPKMSGLELLAEWRGSPRTADLPVFVLTSKDLTKEEEKYVRAHAESLFRKQNSWREPLIKQLDRVVTAIPVERA
jgi:PAS domain S-box-containing protein